MFLVGTVMNIPFPRSGSGDELTYNHTVLFDNDTTASIPLSEMALIILAPLIQASVLDSQDSLLPSYLQLNAKITHKHEGQFCKGFLGKRDGIYQFIAKSHTNKCKEDWSNALSNLPFSWVDMCGEGTLLPGHVSHTFLCSPVFPTALTFYLVASFVSAINFHCDCPPTLLQALADSRPDRDVWLASYKEEKEGLESLNIFCRIALGEYCALREKGAPHAILTMCVLTIKKDENLLPLWAKS
jgi:hypothetical protein